MYEFEIMVRFGETDAAGHVNNASYFIYFEEAKNAAFLKNMIFITTRIQKNQVLF